MSPTDTFNPELFLNATTEEALSTEFVVLPEGEYTGVIESLNNDSFKAFDIKKGENAGKKAYRMDLAIAVNDETGSLKEEMGRAPKARHRFLLDMTDGGALDFGKGKNVQLGRLRAAVGQNKPGVPWAPSMLGGQPIRFKIKHEVYEGRTQANVQDVVAY